MTAGPSLPAEPLVLGVDIGSGGPKIGYVRVTGEPEWWWYERGDILAGSESQDANTWWTTIVAAAQRGLAEGIDPSRVIGVAISGQWASTVPVDEEGSPVADCLMWTDTRGAKYSNKRFGGPIAGYDAKMLATWLRRSGGVPSHSGSDPVSHMLYLLNECPDIIEKARWFLEPVDYLAMRFTGRASASAMSMTAAWLTDNRSPDKHEYDAKLVRLAGVDASYLPPLVPAASLIGSIRDDVADLIGLPRDVRVVTSLPDLHTSAVASGAIHDREAHLSLGTSSWITCPVTMKKTDILRQMASVPGMGIGPKYLIANNQDNAGRALEWYRATMTDNAEYDDLIAEAEQTPAGAGRVLFTPWLSGERSPIDDRFARGGFHNISLDTTRGHLTRAVLEGVALNLRWLLGATEHFASTRFDSIRVMGGGARIDLWCQILADILERRLERVAEPLLGGLRGCGLYFGLAAELINPDEVRDLIPLDGVFEPNPDNQAIYAELFTQFTKLYSNNKSLFKTLNR
jgi:xylulokinase